MLEDFIQSEYLWFGFLGGLFLIGFMHIGNVDKINKKQENESDADSDSFFLKSNKFVNYTFVSTKFEFDSVKTNNNRGYLSNERFTINNANGLDRFKTLMSDCHNTLLLFEGNRIGLFLSKSELAVLPALYDSLEYDKPFGHCTDVIKSKDNASVLVMKYVDSTKSWMLLTIPALLSIPIDTGEDNSMYPEEMVNDAKSQWIQHILDIIDVPYSKEDDDEDFEEDDEDDNNEKENEEVNNNENSEKNNENESLSQNSDKNENENTEEEKKIETGPQI